LLSRCLMTLQQLNCRIQLSNESCRVSTLWNCLWLSESRAELTSCRPNIDHHALKFLCYFVVLCLFVATGTCLPNRCPATVVSALPGERVPRSAVKWCNLLRDSELNSAENSHAKNLLGLLYFGLPFFLTRNTVSIRSIPATCKELICCATLWK
jgi:hypothetical protein